MPLKLSEDYKALKDFIKPLRALSAPEWYYKVLKGPMKP